MKFRLGSGKLKSIQGETWRVEKWKRLGNPPYEVEVLQKSWAGSGLKVYTFKTANRNRLQTRMIQLQGSEYGLRI